MSSSEYAVNEQWWYFTFGWDQPRQGHYVKIYGTYETAREEMLKRYGRVWAFQYSEFAWNEWVKKAKKMGWEVETEL